MFLYFLKTTYIIFLLLLLNICIGLPYFLSFFLSKDYIKTIYQNTMNYLNNFSSLMGIYHKIKFDFDKEYNKHNWNLIICNHSSFIDNFIASKFYALNNINWFDIKTVSHPSNLIEEYFLTLFNFFITTKNLKNDVNYFNKLLYKWRKNNKKYQIILYPEGTIYENQNSNYQNLLNPKTGIFNLLINKIPEIKYIYDLNIIYKIKNKRLIGDYEIIMNLVNPDFEIIVQVNKYLNKNLDNDWLLKNWDLKDKWINNQLVSN